MVAGVSGRSGATHCDDPAATSALGSCAAVRFVTAVPSVAETATDSVPSAPDTQLTSAEPSVTCCRYGVRANA